MLFFSLYQRCYDCHLPIYGRLFPVLVILQFEESTYVDTYLYGESYNEQTIIYVIYLYIFFSVV